ncbi:SSI family serine proteinase inhibitor, partial [Streptomyces sp. NPDC057638]|uniref:SSI family serine proteinase inhibitor n=1 Tax=Streptomyces sp. NPDC057638 TaxID=3346190 RepID=UPI0036C2CB25
PTVAATAEPGRLLLTISGAENTWIRGVLLECPPSGPGQHPDPPGACADLAAADGDLDALRGDPHPCTLEYAPVVATADGTFRGRRISWRKEFASACRLDAVNGRLHRF